MFKTDDETNGYDPLYQPLYKAIQIGDWEKTKQFINAHPEALTAAISFDGKTPLHAAAAFMHLHIVEGLVELVSEDDLELEDADGLTPLDQVCNVGVTQIARCMVNKNKKILTRPNQADDYLPVTQAVWTSKELARYLYLVTPLAELLPEKGHHGASLLVCCLLFDNLGKS